MDAAAYKWETGRPDAFGREAVAETALAIAGDDPALAERVRALLNAAPIAKPANHAGGPGTDVIRVDLPVGAVEAIVNALGIAEAGAVGDDGATTREASRLATLVDRWSRLKFHLDEVIAD